MFQTNHPVTGTGFHDRQDELQKLDAFAAAVRAGAPRWLAIIGPRKVGKTSLILELSRRNPDLDFIIADTLEGSPPSEETFRTVALRAVDAALADELPSSLEILAATRGDFDAALHGCPTFLALAPPLKAAIRALMLPKLSPDLLRVFLDLPERLAEALDRWIAVAIDEFQELAVGARGGDLVKMVRAAWQRHRRVGYIVSGSGRTLLEEMLTREHSPFFQHFGLMYIEPFRSPEAVALLVDESRPDRPIPRALAERAVAALGGHPFYLQLVGESLISGEPPYDDASLKAALQTVLFSETGRLSLYLQLAFDRAVGRSTYLAATLDALAAGPARVTDVAAHIHAGTGDTSRYLERLGDLVRRRDDGTYAIDDPVFALWLRWRRPGGTVVPMTVIGDEAEREVAIQLASHGFDLVYQSRASRGAFDLLALRAAVQLAIQVRRSALPIAFKLGEWQRMSADAARLGWRWTIAAVEPGGAIRFLDPNKARRGKEVRLGEAAVIENVAAWLDHAPPPAPTARPARRARAPRKR
ncbi:MAG TPA: ATP-binding protein [Kofleriaceae bacterium]|nr:ATP-binding protein [Kofleriaceae bacterium]